MIAASYTGVQPAESYAWDANGNAAGSGDVIGPNNEALSDGTYTYSYDAEGNRTERVDIATGAVTDYTWDGRDRLVGVTAYATEGGPATQTVTYSYDAENRWVGETIAVPGQPVEQIRFAYDGDQIVLEFDTNVPSPSGEGQGVRAARVRAVTVRA